MSPLPRFLRSLCCSCTFRAPLCRAFSISAAALALTSSGYAQASTGIVTGRISNQATGEYLRSAVVSVVGTNLSTVAESGGVYTLAGVPAGEAKLSVAYTGLDTAEAIVTVAAGGTVTRDINLTSANYDKDTVRLGEFVVSSEREGNAKALQEQKSSLNAKKVVATDIYGDMAEGNVGEFLKLMPGIAIDYVEADARTMSVRGLDPKYASITIDGMPVASAFSSNLGDGNSRAFEFEQISIASIETVEMSKTPTPDVNASAVAGVVNLRSKGAFDRKGRLIRWSTSLGLNEYYDDFGKQTYFDDDESYAPQLNGALSFSDVYLKGKLGVQAGVLVSNSLTAQKAIVIGYRFNANPDDNATEVPRFTNFNYRDGPKITKRQNANVRFDYKFSPDTWVYLRADVNNYDATFHNRDLFITLTANDDTAATINRLVNAPGSTTTQAGTEYSALSQTSVGGNVSVGSGGSNRKYGHTSTYAAGLSSRRGALQINADFSFSVATNHYRDLPEGFFNGVGAGPATANAQTLRWSRPSADSTDVTITQLGGTPWRDESQWIIHAANATNFPLNSFVRDSRDRRATGKIDFRYPTTWKIPAILKWGGSVAHQDRYNKRDQSQFRFRGPGGGTQQQLVSNAPYIDPVPMEFDMGGNVDGIRTTSRFSLGDLYNEHPDWFVSNPPFAFEQSLRNKVYFDERIDAAYLQSVFKLGKRFDIAPGVRFEATQFETESFRDIGRRAAVQAIGLPATTTDAQARAINPLAYLQSRFGGRGINGQNYDDIFKYLHFNYYPTERIKVRASYHDAITRPDVGKLLGQVVINNEEAFPPTLSAGDPGLTPERSRNINLSLEYYFGRQNLVSLTWFRSDLDGVQQGFVEDLGPEGYDGDPFFAGWRLTTFTNGPKSHRTGIEFDYSQQFDFLPRPFNGLGVFGNYTEIDYDRPEVTLNRSSRLANGGLSYRLGKFSGNIRANWNGVRRITNLTTTGANAGRREYQADRLLIDLNLSYRVGRSLSVFMNGRNLFNEPITTYVISPNYPLRVAKFGAAWTVGIEGTF